MQAKRWTKEVEKYFAWRMTTVQQDRTVDPIQASTVPKLKQSLDLFAGFLHLHGGETPLDSPGIPLEELSISHCVDPTLAMRFASWCYARPSRTAFSNFGSCSKVIIEFLVNHPSMYEAPPQQYTNWIERLSHTMFKLIPGESCTGLSNIIA